MKSQCKLHTTSTWSKWTRSARSERCRCVRVRAGGTLAIASCRQAAVRLRAKTTSARLSSVLLLLSTSTVQCPNIFVFRCCLPKAVIYLYNIMDCFVPVFRCLHATGVQGHWSGVWRRKLGPHGARIACGPPRRQARPRVLIRWSWSILMSLTIEHPSSINLYSHLLVLCCRVVPTALTPEVVCTHQSHIYSCIL